jgi:hypothetical protein
MAGTGGGGDYLQRPRFLAISEFGPGAIIYHEGARYEVKRIQVPMATAGIGTVETQDAYRCESCGYRTFAVPVWTSVSSAGRRLELDQRGLPRRVWSSFSYKTTAYALAARGLVVVNRRTKQWTATVTRDGEFYLAHGQYRNDPEDPHGLGPPIHTDQNRPTKSEESTLYDEAETCRNLST